MRTSKKKDIALCVNLNDFYEHGIARGVVRYAKEAGSWRLFGYGWMFRPVGSLSEWQGDGIIARIEFQEDFERIRTLNLPVVDVAGAFIGKKVYTVSNDDFATGVTGAELFISQYFSNFAFCGASGVEWSSSRLEGFRTRLGAAGSSLPLFLKPLRWWEAQRTSPGLKAWISRLPLPCGVMACNDTAGVLVCAACRELGLRIPEDIAVLGVDNEDVLCELSNPSLSSIPLNCERIGYEAAFALDSILSSGKMPEKPSLVHPGQAIRRASTDALAVADPVVSSTIRYLRDNAHSGINVEDVVRNSGVSRRNLELKFKRLLGKSIHAEILNSKLLHASRLLKETSLPVSRIAASSGFSTASRFFKSFKFSLGLTPSQFRG